LELCNLASAFEICSAPELRELLRRAFEQRRFAEMKPSEWFAGKRLDSDPVMIH
jgi:hypothetical protein